MTTPRMALTMHERRLLNHWVTGKPLVRDKKPLRDFRRKPDLQKQNYPGRVF